MNNRATGVGHPAVKRAKRSIGSNSHGTIRRAPGSSERTRNKCGQTWNNIRNDRPKQIGEQETIMSNTQLLILGNGFDLQCGSESTFDDSKKKHINEIKKMGRSIRSGHLPPKIETIGPEKAV